MRVTKWLESISFSYFDDFSLSTILWLFERYKIIIITMFIREEKKESEKN